MTYNKYSFHYEDSLHDLTQASALVSYVTVLKKSGSKSPFPHDICRKRPQTPLEKIRKILYISVL